MLEYFSLDDKIPKPLTECRQGCWINLADPTPEELVKVAAELAIPFDFLTDSLDPAERPHMRQEGEFFLVICKAPRASNASKDKNSPSCRPGINAGCPPFATMPVGVIVTPQVVVTVCRDPELGRHLVDGKRSDKHSRQGILMALTVLQQSSMIFIDHLQELDALTAELEERMRRSMRNEDLANMMQLEKTLVYFLTSLKGNAMVLEKIGGLQNPPLAPEERTLLVDALIECRQAVDMAEVYIQILSSVSEASASMISNNMNSVMKLLTSITLVLMLPTIIVGAYGMNVALPFQEHPLAFALIVAFTVIVCLLLWFFLSRKRWM
ncbi:MAG: magnesium transporter CorA family protein [Deltaproteobacteria bacterium]|jgi:magnesium transporter|nr:magnesium transporter CorA family protein [Deltaproteobacteria bacterium]